jgi:hypothetical protein
MSFKKQHRPPLTNGMTPRRSRRNEGVTLPLGKAIRGDARLRYRLWRNQAWRNGVGS